MQEVSDLCSTTAWSVSCGLSTAFRGEAVEREGGELFRAEGLSCLGQVKETGGMNTKSRNRRDWPMDDLQLEGRMHSI